MTAVVKIEWPQQFEERRRRYDMPMTKQPIATGRLVWVLLSLAFAVAATKSWFEAKRMSREHWQTANARPVNIAVNFSKPGEIKAQYRQAHVHSQGEILELQLSPKLESDANPKAILAELAGEIVIASLDGKPVPSTQFNHETIGGWCNQEGVLLMLVALAPFPVGEYEMTIRVDTGAEYLADTEQRLVVRYAACECEMIGVLIATIILIGTGLIAVAIALCVLPGLIRHGIRLPQDQSNARSASFMSDESSGT